MDVVGWMILHYYAGKAPNADWIVEDTSTNVLFLSGASLGFAQRE
jgi:hypothetical protein